MAILTNAGVASPISEDFDFQSRLVIPPARDPTNWSMRLRNAQNCLAETHNEDSMAATLNCRDDRTHYPDVGPSLLALFPYSTEEITLLIASPDLCVKVGPLPAFIIMQVERIRLQQKEKRGSSSISKENSKVPPLAGSMVHTNPVERTPGQQPNIIISDIVLYSIRHKLYLPVHWFTNEHLQLVQHRLHDLHTKLIRTDPSSEGSSSELKVSVFDMQKMRNSFVLNHDYPFFFTRHSRAKTRQSRPTKTRIYIPCTF
ncbi:hypothetical protein BT96DRAFT_987164 [Gymnopus androsaceus JB14]|uniref:Uncharacterized protein n=1 Tax=Gymnopus androsaceus JB14 TaxID=1447944 RepID=A0A6A4I4Q6_9AGAR|nr:hypothetical protein BT96DRAFT_987164 [Gymnopus androsaceus JB14]